MQSFAQNAPIAHGKSARRSHGYSPATRSALRLALHRGKFGRARCAAAALVGDGRTVASPPSDAGYSSPQHVVPTILISFANTMGHGMAGFACPMRRVATGDFFAYETRRWGCGYFRACWSLPIRFLVRPFGGDYFGCSEPRLRDLCVGVLSFGRQICLLTGIARPKVNVFGDTFSGVG